MADSGVGPGLGAYFGADHSQDISALASSNHENPKSKPQQRLSFGGIVDPTTASKKKSEQAGTGRVLGMHGLEDAGKATTGREHHDDEHEHAHFFSISGLMHSLTHKSSDPSNEGRAWFYPELPWGTPPSASAPQSGRRFLLVWDIVTLLACLWVAITVPYSSGFEDQKETLEGDGSSKCIFETGGSGLRVFLAVGDVLTDVVFWFDMFISFHLASWKISSEGRPHWELIDDLKTIRRQYFRGHFIIDLVANVPFHYVDCFQIQGGVSPAIKILRLFRLVKLVRLYRVKRWLQGLYFRFPQSEFVIAGIEMIVSLVVLAHWICCLWFSIGFLSGDGWLVGEGLVDSNGALIPDQEYYEWISSFYWAISTMTTIGYGDISATTQDERTLAIFVMVIGCAFFAWATGRITSLLTAQGTALSQFKDKMEELNDYLLSRGISKILTENIRSYYMMKFPTMRIFSEKEIMGDLPNGLRRQLKLELFQDIIKMVPLFAMCSEHTQIEICQRLEWSYPSTGIAICEAGEAANEFHIVRYGIVDVYYGETRVLEARPGDLFGEAALFGLVPGGRRKRTAVARVVSEVGTLQREDLVELLRGFRDFRRQFDKMLALHVTSVEHGLESSHSVSEGMMYTIQWRKILQQMIAAGINLQEPGPAKNIEATTPSQKTKKDKTAAKIAQEEADKDGRNLCTGLQIHLGDLGPLPHEQFMPMALRKPTWMFVAVSWGWKSKIPDGPPTVRAFSEIFKFDRQKSTVGIRKSISLLLKHEHNKWAEMPELLVGFFVVHDRTREGIVPPLDIALPGWDDAEESEESGTDATGEVIKKSPGPKHLGQLVGGIAHSSLMNMGGLAAKNNSRKESSDVLSPGARTAVERAPPRRPSVTVSDTWGDDILELVAEGTIPIDKAIRNRRTADNPHDTSRTWIFPTATSEGDTCVRVSLAYSCDARRYLGKNSAWRRAFTALSQRPVAQFFVEKKLRATRAMREGIVNLLSEAVGIAKYFHKLDGPVENDDPVQEAKMSGRDSDLLVKIADSIQLLQEQVADLQGQMTAQWGLLQNIDLVHNPAHRQAPSHDRAGLLYPAEHVHLVSWPASKHNGGTSQGSQFSALSAQISSDRILESPLAMDGAVQPKPRAQTEPPASTAPTGAPGKLNYWRAPSIASDQFDPSEEARLNVSPNMVDLKVVDLQPGLQVLPGDKTGNPTLWRARGTATRAESDESDWRGDSLVHIV